MKDLSLHLLDILENSAKAGASAVELQFNWHENQLEMIISDNGPGLPDELKDDPANPFKTTRKKRNVGFGLNFLQEAAEQTGGYLVIDESKTGGVKLMAVFHFDHIDAKPLGKMEDSIITAIQSWPELDISILFGINKETIFDTNLIKKELGGVDINQTEITAFLSKTLTEEFSKLYDWASHIDLKI